MQTWSCMQCLSACLCQSGGSEPDSHSVSLLAMTSGIRTSWVRAVSDCLKDITLTTTSADQSVSVDGRQQSASCCSNPRADVMSDAVCEIKSFSRRSRPAARLIHQQVPNELRTSNLSKAHVTHNSSVLPLWQSV